MRTLMFPLGSNPSNWLISSNIVRCTSLSPPAPSSKRVPETEMLNTANPKTFEKCLFRGRGVNFSASLRKNPLDSWITNLKNYCQLKKCNILLPPMASISSKKMIQAFFVLAISNNSRTILAPLQKRKIELIKYKITASRVTPQFLHHNKSSDIMYVST